MLGYLYAVTTPHKNPATVFRGIEGNRRFDKLCIALFISIILRKNRLVIFAGGVLATCKNHQTLSFPD